MDDDEEMPYSRVDRYLDMLESNVYPFLSPQDAMVIEDWQHQLISKMDDITSRVQEWDLPNDVVADIADDLNDMYWLMQGRLRGPRFAYMQSDSIPLVLKIEYMPPNHVDTLGDDIDLQEALEYEMQAVNRLPPLFIISYEECEEILGFSVETINRMIQPGQSGIIFENLSYVDPNIPYVLRPPPPYVAKGTRLIVDGKLEERMRALGFPNYMIDRVRDIICSTEFERKVYKPRPTYK